MSEYDYKPNSHKYKERQKQEAQGEKRVAKVVKGNVKTKKRGEIRKFADVILAEDVGEVKRRAVDDVLIPSIKNALLDLIVETATMLFKGESARGRKRAGDYVSYRSYSDRDRRDTREPRARTRFDFDDLIFESRGEAELVREQMEDMIERYGMVTVADMYDMADLTAPYTGNRYGWTSIRSAEVVRTRDGYVIKLPRAMVID